MNTLTPKVMRKIEKAVRAAALEAVHPDTPMLTDSVEDMYGVSVDDTVLVERYENVVIRKIRDAIRKADLS